MAKKNQTKTKKNNIKSTPPKIIFQMQKQMKKNNPFGNVFFYFILLFGAYLLISTFSGSFNMEAVEVPISEIVRDIKEEKVQDITVAGDKIEVLLKNGDKVFSKKETTVSFDEILTNNDIDRNLISGNISVEHRITFEQILSPLIMIGFPLLILFFIFRQVKGQSGDIMSFGKSRAKVFNKNQSKTTFIDVAGNDEAKKEMIEIVDFLKHPEKYRKLGARIPKGVLLIGPSGVGKTLLAKAIAGEAGVPFFSVAGSEFMEMLVGVGSSRVRDLFNMARQTQPSLIFIDEIDAIGRQRGMGIGGGHDEREQTLNQILTEMDGFDTRTDVIVLAATNRPDMLDPALIRPGRFDRRITVTLPDLKAREEILKIHLRGKVLAEKVDIEKIAKKTVGFSGADLENMLNEAAILAARENKNEIEQKDIEEAALKVTIGAERKTMQTDEERKMTAYHEAGHALVASNVADMDPVYRVSIIARGSSLGHTSTPPVRDRYNETQTRLESMIATMLGGRAAEEIVYNELTIGASDDIDRATKLARDMVTKYGMSPMGPISYHFKESGGWLAREVGEGSQVSEEMAAKIDNEVRKIIERGYDKAKEILTRKRGLLDDVTKSLMEKETLEGEDLLELLK